MPIEFISPCEPATEEEVTEAERLVEVRIPEDYRGFLLGECNGGRPKTNVLDDDDAGVGVDEFLGVGTGGDSDIARVYETSRDRMPSWLLPVAHAAGGNLICLSLREEDRGSVWFWDHEVEAEEGREATEENLTRVDDRFSSFVSRLNVPEGSDLPGAEGPPGLDRPSVRRGAAAQGAAQRVTTARCARTDLRVRFRP